ncbi:hypothetical protein KUTeg_022958, partial [Tegillarca granosa]
REWNDIPLHIRNNPSLYHFKKYVDHSSKVPKYFYDGSRLVQILHTRLRLGCSVLKSHLYNKNIIDDNLCSCGKKETTNHFYCTNNSLNEKLLLFGDDSLTYLQKRDIFLAVQNYIIASKRFS